MSQLATATVWRPVDDSRAPHLLPCEAFPSLEAGMAAFPDIPAEDWCESSAGPHTVPYRREPDDREVAPGSALALAYNGAAARLYHDEGSIEVDANAMVSAHPVERGAYVTAWLWVPTEAVSSEELALAREAVARRRQNEKPSN